MPHWWEVLQYEWVSNSAHTLVILMFSLLVSGNNLFQIMRWVYLAVGFVLYLHDFFAWTLHWNSRCYCIWQASTSTSSESFQARMAIPGITGTPVHYGKEQDIILQHSYWEQYLVLEMAFGTLHRAVCQVKEPKAEKQPRKMPSEQQ